MLKAGAQEPATTKQRIVQAALETLKTEGFAGASARAIAGRGGFNQALIFYHFGTLSDLLLAALDETSASRLTRYKEALAGGGSIAERLEIARRLYSEDLASGHITVVSEMIAGSLNRPDLGPEIVARMEPWVELAEDALRGALKGTGVEALVPVRTAAFAVVALYLGMDLLAHLEADRSRAEAVFDAGLRVASAIAPLLEPKP